MTIEQQVCSLELAKRLKELGVKQESWLYWTPYLNGELLRFCLSTARNWVLPSPFYDDVNDYSAFTVAELGEMLPQSLHEDMDSWNLTITKSQDTENECFGWHIAYLDLEGWGWNGINKENDESIVFWDKNMANAMAQMLIYLLENKLITLEQPTPNQPK